MNLTEVHQKGIIEIPFITNHQTLDRLVKKLTQFEKSGLYLKRSICLQKIAIYCGTNTKYISRTINSTKKQDCNNYINELRIKYIIKKLETNLQYRKYKIAVLASECGFSSPNKFSTVFKNYKGELPSVFIKNLK